MSTPVRITRAVICYPHLYEKHAPPGTTNLKYSAEFLIDEKDLPMLREIDQAFRAAAIEAGKGDRLKFLKSPLKKGSTVNEERQAKGKEPRPELEGRYLLRASDPNYAPVVVDRQMRPIGEDRAGQIFSGCIVNGSVDFYWSNNQTNPGVYCGLRGVQLVDNVNVEEVSGAGRSAGSMFEAVDGVDGDEDPGGFGQPADADVGDGDNLLM